MSLEVQLADLARRVANMIRLGRVAAIDFAGARVRVQAGDMLTGWLPWQVSRAGATRTWDPPSIGEQVMVISPSGEPAAGIVIPALYCNDQPAPDHRPSTHVIAFPDGARISYDHASSALDITGVATVRVVAAESVTFDTPYAHFTGQVEIDDVVTYHNGMVGEGGGGNAVTITGDLVHEGGVISSNGIVLHTHTHSGVQTGGGSTGGPQ